MHRKFKIGYRTTKTALGTTIAIMIAGFLGLDFYTSAGIVTILCIQVTKKQSLHAVGARLLAVAVAVVYSYVFFEWLAYHPIVIGLMLLLFIPTTVVLKANEGIVTSCVIILHLFSSGRITADLIVNEAILVIVGTGVALVMNLYMPSLENKLTAYQEKIEINFATILMEIVRYVRNNDHSWSGKEITETAKVLNEAKSMAFREVENRFLRENNAYYHYFRMRERQFEIIERILPLVTNIPQVVKQSGFLADFIEELAENVRPQNTAFMYLKELGIMEKQFKEMPLPVTREEFESRAALLQLMKEIERYLLLKDSFSGFPLKAIHGMKHRSFAYTKRKRG